MPETFTYDARVLEALEGHGLKPLPATSPQQLRDALSDLYRYEIRQLRTELVAGRVYKQDYAGLVTALRRRYWLLSVPVQAWLHRPGV